MAVYVDDMRAHYRRMIMCHMVADTLEELHAMAKRIGIKRRWFQQNSSYPHYDICLAKRALAMRYGSVEVTRKQLAFMIVRARVTGSLGHPDRALEWYEQQHRRR